MSSNLSAIQAQTSAILEKLYNERGQPDQLDESFIQEYFKLVKDDLNLDDKAEVAPLAPYTATARLSQEERGLTGVMGPLEKGKFLVSTTTAVKAIAGTIQKFGSDPAATGAYVMANVKGVTYILITSGSAVFVFIGTLATVKAEHGTGKWVKV